MSLLCSADHASSVAWVTGESDLPAQDGQTAPQGGPAQEKSRGTQSGPVRLTSESGVQLRSRLRILFTVDDGFHVGFVLSASEIQVGKQSTTVASLMLTWHPAYSRFSKISS